MSTEKTQSPQFQQQNAARPQVDSLDAHYKPIGISAVTAATAQMHVKIKKPGEQMG